MFLSGFNLALLIMKMRFQITLLLSALILFSCNNSSTSTAENNTPSVDTNAEITETKAKTLYDLKSKFKYQNVEVFEIDNYTWETRVGKYNEPAPDEYILLFPDSARYYIEGNPEKDYLYSWQERDPNFIEFTILMQHGRDNCDFLIYYIFTKNGEYVSDFKVATRCDKEEGWKYYSKGEFTSKNVYIERCAEHYGVQPEPGFLLGDSTAFEFKIKSNGQVDVEQILSKEFKKPAK